jgi:hypothetical protein
MDCSRTGKGHASSRCTKDGEAPIGLERVNNGKVVVGYTWGIPGDRLEALASSALPGLENLSRESLFGVRSSGRRAPAAMGRTPAFSFLHFYPWQRKTIKPNPIQIDGGKFFSISSIFHALDTTVFQASRNCLATAALSKMCDLGPYWRSRGASARYDVSRNGKGQSQSGEKQTLVF